MRKITLAFWLILTLALGYELGQLLPIEYLRPTIVDKNLSINDLYTRVISVIGTLITSLAVVVALFKEDIRKRWEYAKPTIDFKSEKGLAEVLDQVQSNIKAKKYESIICVTNVGNLATKNCEIYLEKLTFKNVNYATAQEIPTTGQPIEWNGKTETKTLIPSKAKGHLTVVEIISPQQQSVPSGSIHTDTKPRLKIGNIECPQEFINGIFHAKFVLYSENTKPCEYNISVNWNGKWEERLTEMSNCVSINKVL